MMRENSIQNVTTSHNEHPPISVMNGDKKIGEINTPVQAVFINLVVREGYGISVDGGDEEITKIRINTYQCSYMNLTIESYGAIEYHSNNSLIHKELFDECYLSEMLAKSLNKLTRI